MDTPLNIVLVEDHQYLREVTADVLRCEGYSVIALECAEDLEEQVGSKGVDLFVLDLNLPGEDGISLSRRLRKSHPEVGIIMVTARSKPEDMTLGYTEGADMYLMKPLAPETLLAAVQSFRRRLAQRSEKQGLQINKRNLILSGPEGSVALQPLEADLLTAFARAPQQRLETWQLAELMGGEEEGASKSGIEVRITRLRKKLQSVGGGNQCIKSIRTVGYQFCMPLQIL